MGSDAGEQLAFFGVGSEKVWSYSRLKSLRRCPLEYKVRWVDGQESLFQPGHIDVLAGRLLHQIIREYYRQPLGSHVHRLLLGIYDKVAPRTPGWKEDLQGENRVLAALRLFADSRAAGLRSVALEVACRARIGGVEFAGHADLIFQVGERPRSYGILEFKLNDVEQRAQDPSERFLQCIIYYLGLPVQFRRSAEIMGVYIFESGTLLQAQIQQPVVEKASRIIEAAIQHANGPEFPPIVNPFCSSCGYRMLCPEYSKIHSKSE